MRKWLRRIRGALGMGLTWAIAWALVVVALGVTSIVVPGTPLDALFELFDDEMLPAVVVPAFAGGLVFSAVLGIAARRRRFDELSLPRFAALGALGGSLVTLLPVGTALANGAVGVPLAAAAIGGVAVLCGISAAGSLWLARWSEDRELLEAGADVDSVGLSRSEARDLLQGRS